MSKREEVLLIVRKEPGKAAVVDYIENRLEVFQAAVGGHIEAVTIDSDMAIICNEEGRLLGLPHNVDVCGIDFCGTVFAVGVKGEDFASIKGAHIPLVLRMMGGDQP